MKWHHRQRAEREALDDLIKATPIVGLTETEAGVYEFGGPDRTEEIIAKEKEDAEASKAKTSGLTFVTENWVTAARMYMGEALAQRGLDVVDDALLPEKTEEDVIPARKLPVFVHKTGVSSASPPLPSADLGPSKIVKLKGVPKRRGR